MSEQAQEYKVNKPDGLTREVIQAWPSAREFTDPHYEPPTPEQVKQLQIFAGWSQNDVAKLVGVYHTDKGSPTVRKWIAPVSNERHHRDIPYSAWRLMLIEAGILRPTWERGTESQHWMDSEVAEIAK